MNTLVSDSSDKNIDFQLVYISEAHAEDEWPIGSDIVVNQHKNVEERRIAAQRCIDATGINWPVMLDNVITNENIGIGNNSFESVYSPWPIRFYVFQRDGDDVKVNWISEPTLGYYEWPEIIDSISRCCYVP